MTALADRLTRHAAALERAGRSPLYVALMRGAAQSATAGGPVADVFPEGPGPPGSVPALRLMAALHHLVLAGEVPELARFFPSAGGSEAPERAWQVARATIERNRDEMRRLVRRTVQTNEPGRSAPLYGALLWLADRHRLPVRLLEIGASAGLNLQVDRYRYLVRGSALGDPASPLSFVEPWEGVPVRDPWSVQRLLRVAERRGCDSAPLDVTTAQGATTVLSYIWPDERERLLRVKRAIPVARRRPVCVEAAAASPWIKKRLAERQADGLTVVWQSVVRQYLGDGERRDLDSSMEEAGSEASETHPLAWVTLEPTDEHLSGFELSCRVRPPDTTVVLAYSGDHGPPVRWQPSALVRGSPIEAVELPD